MADSFFCGLDFGTSNSSVSIATSETVQLIALENGRAAIPSAIFFDFDEDTVNFGQQAIDEYVLGARGRLLRSLKSVLGTSLMEETTQIKHQELAFSDILGLFIGHLKHQTETVCGQLLDRIVLGRPVNFVDHNPEADRKAAQTLAQIAADQGFRHIEFQYEPIAAALDYEQQVTAETIALIVDIGGGTADFSIVRLAPERRQLSDRRADVLANHGVHVGGTDFDRWLSLHSVMPHFGYKTATTQSNREMPAALYFDLATWHLINLLYSKETYETLREMRFMAADKQLIDRLSQIIETRSGHRLAMQVEKAKIDLTGNPSTCVDLDFIDPALQIITTRTDLDQAIRKGLETIMTTIADTIAQAGIRTAAIQAVFLTGGSTAIPTLQNSILELFPHAEIVQGDLFGSVGMGLALDARRKFI
jgi:hypothetical chaperone protein